MGILLKEIEDYDGAEAALRSGMLGAMVYASWVVFSVAMTFIFTRAGALFPLLTPTWQLIVIAVTVGQLGVALFAAWRFWIGKGAIAGSLTALVLVAEVVLDLINHIFLGIIWYAVLLGVLLALINGVRGALAMRDLHDPAEVVEAFE